MRDFEAYWSAGAVWREGGDPYGRDVWKAERTVPRVDARRDELLPFVGPAAFRPLWTALAALPFAAASRLWAAVLVAAAAWVAIGSLVLGAPPRRWSLALAAVIAAFAFAPSASAVALGQTALVAAAAVVGALVALERRSMLAAFAAFVVAAIQPNLALVLAARLRDRCALSAAAAAAAIFVTATLVFGGGPPGFATYVHHVQTHGAAERDVVIQSTPAAIAWELGASRTLAQAAGSAVAIATLLAAIVALIRVRFDRVEQTAFAAALLPLAVPFFHEHDYALVLLPVCILVRRAQGAILIAALVGSLAVGTDWLAFAQRPEAYAQHLALLVATACALLVMARRATAGAVLACALTVCAIAAIGIAARAAPAPTWPDALPASFHARAHDGSAAVWHEEQRQSGLERQVAAWGVLRIPGLAGAALLALALLAHARERARTRYTSTSIMSSKKLTAFGCQPRTSSETPWTSSRI